MWLYVSIPLLIFGAFFADRMYPDLQTILLWLKRPSEPPTRISRIRCAAVLISLSESHSMRRSDRLSAVCRQSAPHSIPRNVKASGS